MPLFPPTTLPTVVNVKDPAYGAVGNGVASDMTALRNAVSAATAAGGGTVDLPPGTYKVASSGRTDTITGVAGNVFSDVSAVSGDVGSYVVGVGVQAEVPQIVSVVPGVSFTTDIAPVGVPTHVLVFNPAIVLPPGVQLLGAGSTYSSTGLGSGTASTSKILDTGTGITVLIRGSNGVGPRTAIRNLSIWGQNTNVYGVFVGNFAWFLTMENCDVSFHGVAGMALDGNINSHDIRDTIFMYNGTVGATGYTGGVVTNPYWNQSSAALNFYNCFFNANWGWGIVNGLGSGAYAVMMFGCQFNNTQASAATGSGTSASLSTLNTGNTVLIGCWSESAALYDLQSNGPVVLIGCSLSSASAIAWNITGGYASCFSCWFQNHSTKSITLGGGANITWSATNISDPFFYSGGPDNAHILGFGTSAVITGGGNGLSPGSFGAWQANTLWQGSGVPGNGNGANGDTYLRVDTPGTANQRLYVKSAGAWVGIV
jgi:Pectate lyase superfamily protein